MIRVGADQSGQPCVVGIDRRGTKAPQSIELCDRVLGGERGREGADSVRGGGR